MKTRVLLLLFCEIDGLMTIGLSASKRISSIYFPGPISIPNSPSSISDMKLFLESLPESPFYRIVDCFKYDMIFCFEIKIFNFKYAYGCSFSFYVNYEIFLWAERVQIDLEIDITRLEKSVYFFLHFRGLSPRRVYRKARMFLKF